MNDFLSLWCWLTGIAESSRAEVPLVIHSRSGDRSGWEWEHESDASEDRCGRCGKTYNIKLGHDCSSPSVIRSMPFSKSFTRRVDHELPRSIRTALDAIRPSKDDPGAIGAARRSQWRVVASVLKDGETETETCRLRLRMSEYQFRVSAISGILALRSALERET